MANIAKICAGRLPALSKYSFGLQNIRTFASGNGLKFMGIENKKKTEKRIERASWCDAIQKLCNFK